MWSVGKQIYNYKQCYIFEMFTNHTYLVQFRNLTPNPNHHSMRNQMIILLMTGDIVTILNITTTLALDYFTCIFNWWFSDDTKACIRIRTTIILDNNTIVTEHMHACRQ